MSLRSSIVRYDTQRVASRTPGATSACVGQASRHSVQRAALVERRLVDLERQAADDLGQQRPRSDRGADHARVLADPSNPGVPRVHTLLNRTGVDIRPRLERLVGRAAHPREQRLHAAARITS